MIQTVSQNSDVQIKVTPGGSSYDYRYYSATVTAKNSSGTVLWTHTYNNLPCTELPAVSEPYIQGNRLYMVIDATLTCFDLYTGDILWTLNGLGGSNEIAVINDHQLVVTSYYGPHLTIVTYQNDELISSSTYDYSNYRWPNHLKVVNGNIQMDMESLEPDCMEKPIQLTIDLKGNILFKKIL